MHLISSIMTDEYNTTEVCRLCTVRSGMRMHIFDKEGEQRQLLFKIRTCLPIVVSDISHNLPTDCRELYTS